MLLSWKSGTCAGKSKIWLPAALMYGMKIGLAASFCFIASSCFPEEGGSLDLVSAAVLEVIRQVVCSY